MDYIAIKTLHIACASVSGSLFLLRGICMLRGSSALAQRWSRIVPHMVDTVLLASALMLVFWSGQYPFVHPWLGAKVLALLVYIALGSIALKRGRNKTVRTWAFIAALAVFAYIGSVALTRQVLVFA